MTDADVVVVGCGNAAMAAALTARDCGKRVLVLESAPEHERGGNSHFTGGLFRFPHEGVADLSVVLPELGEDRTDELDVDPYTEAMFFQDMGTLTRYQCDPDLTEILVTGARDAMRWLSSVGVRFLWSRGRHAYKVEGKFRFWGGAVVEVNGGGMGLMETLISSALRSGVTIEYRCRCVGLLQDERGQVTGVRVSSPTGMQEISADAVVLACGGFESSAEKRARYLGQNWDLARVRGTKYNMGDGLEMALGIGARPYGHWSGCHATAWDANAPIDSDPGGGDAPSRHSYPLGIVVDENGQRFVDEGANFQTHTYAKYGAEILKQPGGMAFQVFDSKVWELLRADYRDRRASRVTAQSVGELGAKLEIDIEAFTRTVEEFNAAVAGGAFDPNVLDGLSTDGLHPDKSNWAQPIDAPPFYGFPVTTGITFTFGGLRIGSHGEVMDRSNAAIPGLFAAGEMVGGLFFHNYPSGTGLTSGTVFGRIAGRSAAGA